MYIELIDLLRCPREHEESWLVAAFYEMQDRFVIEGQLGCPICSASYSVVSGIADFRERHDALPSTVTASPEMNSGDETVRVAAMLGLTKPGSVAVLVGMDADIAGEVSELSQSRVISLNSRTSQSRERENVASVLCHERFPLAATSVDGVMLECGLPRSAVREAARVLKTGGRLVAGAEMVLAGSLRELARDERYVVAESTGPLLSLSR